MVFLIQKVTLPTIKLIKFIILATIVCFCAFASYAQNPVTKPPVLIKDSVTYTDTIFLGLYKTAFLEIKGRETKSVNIGQQSDDIEIGQRETAQLPTESHGAPGIQRGDTPVIASVPGLATAGPHRRLQGCLHL